MAECVFCLFFWSQKNVAVGRAGIDPLTVWYIHFRIWSRRLCSTVSRLICNRNLLAGRSIF